MKRPEPMNLSAKACRLLRPTALAGTLALVCGMAVSYTHLRAHET